MDILDSRVIGARCSDDPPAPSTLWENIRYGKMDKDAPANPLETRDFGRLGNIDFVIDPLGSVDFLGVDSESDVYCVRYPGKEPPGVQGGPSNRCLFWLGEGLNGRHFPC